MIVDICTMEDINILKDYVKEHNLVGEASNYHALGCILHLSNKETFAIQIQNLTFEQKNELMAWLKSLNNNDNIFIYGKDPTKHIVSIEVKDDVLELFIEENGKVRSEFRDNNYWLLAAQPLKGFNSLKGNLHYKYIKTYISKDAWYADKNNYRTIDTYSISNDKEAAMVMQGISYYKGMKIDDVSRLHFDLETIGLLEAPEHKILLISTTFVKQGTVQKKLFSLDEYESEAGMLQSFCTYIREINPSIISGFNIFGFDLPYMQLCADRNDIQLELGRNGSPIRFDKYTSKFRKDGSQDYDYKRCHIYGREIVDMMFVAYHFDFARKYERYALKSIIKQEGLEKLGRQFYDASLIARNWNIPKEREKIKAYCIDDADDSEALYKLMIAAYFYLTPHIPKSFQTINYSATGSQINSFLMRSYLQQGHSIPKADESVKFLGAISDGNPGIYKNVFKVDVASLYPSIMLQYEIHDPKKDPFGYFLKMVQHFTTERLINKKKAKDTGDRYYEELEQSQKIVINSAYGLLGATGLNFNFPLGAAKVTGHGREILKKAILWATGKEYIEKEKE